MNRASRITRFAAGWSSPVARRAHNPKVACSNHAPATKSRGPPVNVKFTRGLLLSYPRTNHVKIGAKSTTSRKCASAVGQVRENAQTDLPWRFTAPACRRSRIGVRCMSEAMGREDWYRRTTWSEIDQKQFFDRLKRSREAFHKVQYLRIQALYLQESGLHHDAIALLNKLLTDYPNESFEELPALHQKAECLWAVGDHIGSFEAYAQALASQRRDPHRVTYV